MKWEITPQGYRVVKAVITRAGEFKYRGSEIGLTDSRANQPILLNRTIEDLSRPETLKSFEGLPITITHPNDSKVVADDWRGKSVGHIQNVRAEDNLIVCDAYIQDKPAIELLEQLPELRELSVGWEDNPTIVEINGKFYHKNMVGNHISVVVEGRAGFPCRILTDSKGKKMNLKQTILAKLKGGKPLTDADGVTLTAEKIEQIIAALNDPSAEDGEQSKIDQIIAMLKEKQTTPTPTDEGVPPVPNAGDDIEAIKAQNAQLQAENEQLKTENAQLKAQIDELTNTSATQAAINDAKAYFPKSNITDAKNPRDVYAKVLIDNSVYTEQGIKGLSDAEVRTAFITLQTMNKKKSNIGKVLLNDNKPATKTGSQRLGGK